MCYSLTQAYNATANTQLGYSKPAYAPKSKVLDIQTKENSTFVRVYRKGVNSQQGRWVMRYSDIEGLTPLQIKEKFALPDVPTHYSSVTIKSGANIRTGVCAGYKEGNPWGIGGGTQFDIYNVPSNMQTWGGSIVIGY